MTISSRTRLEFHQGTSNKYYEVWIDETVSGCEVKARYGATGSSGIEITKASKLSKNQALSEFSKLVNSKTSKGYAVFSTEGVTTPPPAPRKARKVTKAEQNKLEAAAAWLNQETEEDIVI